MIDIISENGRTVINGSGNVLDIALKFSNVVSAVYDALIKCGLSDEGARELMQKMFEVGVDEGAKHPDSVGIIIPKNSEKE